MACAGITLFASSALAGPTWTFGPNDEGMLKLDYVGQFQLNYRDTGAGSGSDDDTMEFNFRRDRIALIGAYENLGIYVQTEYTEDINIGPFTVSDGSSNEFQLLDAQIRYKFNDAFQVRAGKFKYNLTRENLEACEKPLTLDRSVLIRAPYVSTRDKGVAVWGNLFNDIFQYRLDVMNGRNDSDSAPDSNFRYTGRAHLTFLDKETGYGYRGTYMGKKKVITLGAAYSVEEDIAYADCANETDAVDYKAWTIDLFAEYPIDGVGTFTLSSAYVDYDLDDAYQGADPDAGVIGVNGEKNGSYTKVGYMLPNLPLQFFFRAENWSLAQLDGVYDQEIDWYGGGLNYYFRGQNLKLTVEYSTVEFDTETPDYEDFDSLTVQLQVVF
ncbi:MAG: porin [Desulfuromonadaceae bacterium]|nr:porin [Desulfuromonadaceae bacterium]